MANEKDFAKELNELITSYIQSGSDPQAIVDELNCHRPASVVPISDESHRQRCRSGVWSVAQ